MSFSARLIVTAEAPADAAALAAQLDRIGMTTRTVAGGSAACVAAATYPCDAALIDVGRSDAGLAAALARRLREAARPRLLPVIAIGDGEADFGADPDAFDAVMRRPVHPAQIAARVEMVLRLVVMEDEARLRARSLSRRGALVDLSLNEDDLRAPQVLFAGQPTPAFLGLDRAVRQAGGSVTAAFSAFTAFDYLHERDFDAVVLNADGEHEPAFTIAAALRRNTRLIHLPALLLVDLNDFGHIDEAFARGVSDLLDVRSPPVEMARRTVSLARERRRREAVKAAFGQIRAPGAVDAETGLAAPAFFIEHLDAMCQRTQSIGRALSLVVVRVEPPATVAADAVAGALTQLASMLRHLIRSEDFAGRLEPGVFAIVMPGASAAAAAGAARRLSAVAECTAFDGGDLSAAFQVRMTTWWGELSPGEAGPALITRVLQGPRARAG